MAITLITPLWEGLPWLGTFMGLSFGFEIPPPDVGGDPLTGIPTPRPWARVAFRFEATHSWA